MNAILIWIILGLISGWLAGQIMRGYGFGLVGNIIVGILGAMLGGWLGGQLGIDGAQTSGINIPSIITAVLGAVVLLFIAGMIKRNT